MAMYPPDEGAAPALTQEFDAGAEQSLVVYRPQDSGTELDVNAIYGWVATDAARRDAEGQRLVSMHSMPLRHAGVYLGRNGSGFETSVAIVAIYERRR